MTWLDDSDRRILRRAAEREEERRRRWNQRGVLWWLTIPQLPVVLMAVAALVFTVANDREDRHVAASLQRDGVVVEGSAIHFEFRTRGDIFFGDRVQVAFKTEDGRDVKTWVPNGIPVDRGAVSVRYLRSDPSVARLVADPTPREGRSLTVLAVYAGVLVLTVPMTLILRQRSLSRA
ncbi:MAG: hypothetical protein LC721_10910 [Actinobacteria bacterium]|nr:hypothetical protein [Actinomycetota bacterium]